MEEESVRDDEKAQAYTAPRATDRASHESQADNDISPSAQMYQTASQGTTEYHTSGTTQTKRHATGSGEVQEQPKH